MKQETSIALIGLLKTAVICIAGVVALAMVLSLFVA